VPFAALFAISLVVVALLPLYVERTLTEVLYADGSGGAIEWGWKRCSLREYWADYRYIRREQNHACWLGVNIALAATYALALALPVNIALRWSRDR
jgi:hypothetical protein